MISFTYCRAQTDEEICEILNNKYEGPNMVTKIIYKFEDSGHEFKKKVTAFYGKPCYFRGRKADISWSMVEDPHRVTSVVGTEYQIYQTTV